jgi:L-lactate dehydrogenase complex protein LldG
MTETNLERFIMTAEKVGASVLQNCNIASAAKYIAGQLSGSLLLPPSPSLQRSNIQDALAKAGVSLITTDFRQQAATAGGGLTGANFGIADTGTIVLESTAEPTRLASTLPEQHFVLLDPEKIVADGIAAVAPLRSMHQRDARNFIAYITGPSRTADIERVLTIGVHGPKQLHILLIPKLSSDLMEN